MKYYCKDCHHFLDEDMLTTTRDIVGECWGQPAYETYLACSYCGSTELEDAHECVCCGREFLEDEGTDQVCQACLDASAKDWRFWYRQCDRRQAHDYVSINSLLADKFTEQEIEHILLEALEKRTQANPDIGDCTDFIQNDPSWADECIVEQYQSKN